MKRVAFELAVAAVAVVGGLRDGIPAQSEGLEVRARLQLVSSDRAEHPVETPLRIAEQQWAAAGVESYRLTVTVGRFGVNERHTLTLVDGEITEVQSNCTLGGEFYPCGEVEAERFTVPGLFAQIHERLRHVPIEEDAPGSTVPGTPFVDASFAPGLGLPYHHTWGLRLVPDAGETVTIQDFRAVNAEEDLASARLRWQGSAIDDYVMELTIYGPTDAEVATAEVLGGDVVSLSAACDSGAGPVTCEPSRPELATVEGLFEYIEIQIGDPNRVVNATYDVAAGRPTTIAAGTLGSGSEKEVFGVSHFEPLP